MKSVLIVIDVQNEFLAHPQLVPTAEIMLPRVTALLHTFRDKELPVIHVHYVTEQDGRGYLPHHKSEGRKRCERGTTDADPHPLAEPLPGEALFAKQSYNAFSSHEFENHLKHLGATTLIICGLYSHVCIRQTALEALDRNYQVKIAQDAIASYDPLHAQITQSFLVERGVQYWESITLIEELLVPSRKSTSTAGTKNIYPVGHINGNWKQRFDEQLVELRNPSSWEQILGYVPKADANTIDSAVSTSVQIQSEWKSKPLEERLAKVEKWAQILESRADQFLPPMTKEVGKPISACRIEMGLLQQSLRVLLETISHEPLERICKQTSDQLALARRCPQGIVAIIAPWNNPVFLPACKIATAIASGNGVVWKPALPCARTSMILQDSLLEAGLPTGLVNLIFGGADTAQQLIVNPGIHAVTLTGSVDTGRKVGTVCGALLKPLQAELGGNNAAIVTANCHLKTVADKVALSAFGYAGQACTATRRVIVDESIADDFVTLLKTSTQALVIGDPNNENTIIGPVISKTHQRRIEQLLAEVEETADIFKAEIPTQLTSQGCWLPPIIIQKLKASTLLIQQETFAPILVIQTATNIEDAVRLNNEVPHGLITSIFCDDKEILQKLREGVETGIVQLNLPSRNLHMESPFGGWKDSGLGSPEHGIWDLDFYTRWQAINERKT